jgi:glycosyltransferase involved in cell wall biosynthesis
MILLLEDQERAERMGRAALARVQEKFDSHLTTRLIEEVYRSVTV